jgi:hypothetical protein
MKNAPTQKSGESVRDKRDYTPGTMPELYSTVRAAVLAELLSGQVMTGMDSVFAQSTTRLSAVIYALENTYGWVIQRQDIDVNTKDGRSTRIVGYYLDQATIQEAAARGSRQWIRPPRSRPSASNCACTTRVNSGCGADNESRQ